MYKRRYLIIDDEMEKDLTMLCDIAMRFSGMQMAKIVANIANAMNRYEEDDFYSHEDD